MATDTMAYDEEVLECRLAYVSLAQQLVRPDAEKVVVNFLTNPRTANHF